MPEILKTIKTQRKQNLNDKSNNRQLDKEDNQQSNVIIFVFILNVQEAYMSSMILYCGTRREQILLAKSI